MLLRWYRAGGIALLVVALMVSVSCSGAAAPAPHEIVVAIRVAPNTLDPRMGNDEGTQRISQLVFSSLVDIGDDLTIKPALAERLDHPDPLTYVAVLRRGVKFHDGHELTSRDVVFTFAPFLDPAYLSPFKGAYRMLASVTATSDYTVEFKLKEPFAGFPIQLVTPPIVPAGAGPELAAFPVGSGPYRFVSYAVDDLVVLAAFEGYYDGLPSNSGIRLKVVPDDTMRGLELRKGSVDVVINDLPPDIVHQLDEDGHFTMRTSPGLDFSYLAFNMRDPVLRDKRVRHAIGYAIDRDAIVKYLRRGLARPATGLIPSLAWAYEPDVFRFSHDPARARQLLDEAGYPDPDGDGPLPRLRLSLTISTNEETRLQSTVIQQDLRNVGIDMEVRSFEFATFFADVLKGNFQMYSLQWVGGAMVDPDILRRVFHSQQVPPAGFNRGYYSNPEVDRLIDRATMASGDAERQQQYAQVQKILADDAPYISIWNRTNVTIAGPSVSNLAIGPTGDYQALKNARK